MYDVGYGVGTGMWSM